MLVGIVMMRGVTSYEMGVMGALALFVMVGQVLTDGGVMPALLRRRGGTDAEYSAVLLTNVAVSVVLYVVLYVAAPLISDFFRIEELTEVSRVLFLVFPISSLYVVQFVILNLHMQFKRICVANCVAVALSGVVAIVMLRRGYGVWALVMQQVGLAAMRGVMYWALSPWRGFTWRADWSVIGGIVRMTSVQVVLSLASRVSRYMQNVIIGRTLPQSVLGNFYSGQKYAYILPDVVGGGIGAVVMPLLTQVKDDPMRSTRCVGRMMCLSSAMMFPVAAIALVMIPEAVEVVLTDRWLPIVPYFRMVTVAMVMSAYASVYSGVLMITGNLRLVTGLEMMKNVMIIASFATVMVDDVAIGGWLSMVMGGDRRVMVLLAVFVAAWWMMAAVGLCMMRRVVGYGFRMFAGDVWAYVVASAVASAVAYGVSVCVVDGAVVRLVMGCVSALVSYAVVLMVVREPLMCEVMDRIRAMLRCRSDV